MRFERTQIETGRIGEDDAPSRYEYKWHNDGTAPLVITRTVTTCGCAVATFDKQPVRAGGQSTVTVTYHPKGHPGNFYRRIFVYTQLSDKEPTAILELTGSVEASKRTDDDYPYAAAAQAAGRPLRPVGRPGRGAHRMPQYGRQSAAPGQRSEPASCGNHAFVRTRGTRPGPDRRFNHPVRPRRSAAAPAPTAAADHTGARRPAEPTHPANPVRRNRIRNR